MPEDVVACLDQLYGSGRITLAHVRVLRRWGERARVPNLHRSGEQAEAKLWHEALDRLDWPLRVRGIVRTAT